MARFMMTSSAPEEWRRPPDDAAQFIVLPDGGRAQELCGRDVVDREQIRS
jgi:hypothetical protein